MRVSEDIILRIWGLDQGMDQFHSNSVLNHITYHYYHTRMCELFAVTLLNYTGEHVSTHF